MHHLLRHKILGFRFIRTVYQVQSNKLRIFLLNTETKTLNEEDIKHRKEMVTDANTDLLFSLFRVVEDEQRKSQGQSKITLVRRGRLVSLFLLYYFFYVPTLNFDFLQKNFRFLC